MKDEASRTMVLIDTLRLVAELAVLFFGVTFAVQLFQRRMGQDRFRSWMGGPPLVAALKGIAIGFLTPFCTFTAIPLLIGFRQADVPVAGYVAFIVAAPVLDPVLFGALVIIVGLGAALIYLAVAFVAALSLAMIAQRTGIENRLRSDYAVVNPSAMGADCDENPTGAPSEDLDDSSCEQVPGTNWSGVRVEVSNAALASVVLLRSMGPLLALGVAISMVIDVFVPPSLVESVTAASDSYSIPLAAAIGTPLYVSTAVFVPIADALTTAGVGVGAVVALTIAGAGANLPEFVILSKLAQPRLIAVFFSFVFGVAVIGGLLTQFLTV